MKKLMLTAAGLAAVVFGPVAGIVGKVPHPKFW